MASSIARVLARIVSRARESLRPPTKSLARFAALSAGHRHEVKGLFSQRTVEVTASVVTVRFLGVLTFSVQSIGA